MSQFVTVSRTDKEFWPMLTGRFSKTQWAQPVRNLNVNSDKEQVTFKIIENASPSIFQALWHWYSLTKNIYLLFPIVGGLSFLTYIHGPAQLALVAFSFLALQFFLLAMTLYNDFSDYVNGIDRINEYNDQKPLVQGLLRPYQAQQLSYFFLGLSLLSSLYCFIVKPPILLFALFGFFMGFGLSSTFVSRYFKGVSLVVTFLLGGPLLILGYEYLLYDQFTLGSVFLGMVFGYHALKYDFSQQIRDIYFSSKAKIQTLTNFFGFERSKWIYSFMSVLHLLFLFLFAMYFQRSELALVFLVSLCFEAYINSVLYGAASFLSSGISNCLSLQKFHYTVECTLLVFIFLSPQWLSLF